MEPLVHLTGLAASTRTAAGQVQPSHRRPRRSAADALHTQRDHASFLIDRGADYLLVVKASQPCTPSSPDCRGARSRSWTAPVIMAMGGSRSGP